MDRREQQRKWYRKHQRDAEFHGTQSDSDESDSSVSKRRKARSSSSGSDNDDRSNDQRSGDDVGDEENSDFNESSAGRRRKARRGSSRSDSDSGSNHHRSDNELGDAAHLEAAHPDPQDQNFENAGENNTVEPATDDEEQERRVALEEVERQEANEDEVAESESGEEENSTDESEEVEEGGRDQEVPDENPVVPNDESDYDEYESADDESVYGDAEGVEDLDDEPLYENAPITFRESLLAILTFALSHRLTGVCINDLLSLIALHCRPNNLCLKTLGKFKEYFSMIGKKIIIPHHYCSVCEVHLERDNPVCAVNQSHTVSFFIEMPIVQQLQTLFKRPGFFDMLQFRFHRQKKNPDNIEDIYDGEIYKEQFNNGFLSNPNHISFFMYFDGVSLFKSSKFSLWPVYYSINELNYKQRTQKENILLAGLWFGPKPNANLLLRPLYTKMLDLETNGVDVSLSNGENIRVRAKVLGAVGDLPAKAAFMRFIQYNGQYSCFNCMSSGFRHEAGNTTVQVYPYSRNFVLRTSVETAEYAEQATIARRADPDASVYGVKGPSILSLMLPNLIMCMANDIMHGAFLGVMKTLMNFWFDSSFSAFPFSIRHYSDLVDARLRNIQPPFSFQRLPRCLKDLLLYKASDFKIFMFYYSLPVLLGILPAEYWLHHAKFVTAIAILCQESINPDQLNEAEELLHSYVSDFQRLYGLRYLGLNVHQLLHLVNCVRSLGPAFVYSCFFYESVNGQLTRLVHGTRHSALQICSTFTVLMNLPEMIRSLNENEAKSLCSKFLLTGKLRVKTVEIINENTFVAGVYSACHPIPRKITQLLQQSYNIVGGKCKYFHRLKKKGILYCSEKYVRSKRKTSCFAEFMHNNIPYLCKIQSFLKWSACDLACPQGCEVCPKMFLCLVRIYERIPWELTDHYIPIGYLNKVRSTETIELFSVAEIRSVCVYVAVDGNEFMSVPVNSLEVE